MEDVSCPGYHSFRTDAHSVHPRGCGEGGITVVISEERIATAANAIGEIELFTDNADLKGYARYEALARVALEAADAAMTDKERDAIADAVLAKRKERFERSFDIVCPDCGREMGHACTNFGSAGGPMNCMGRINAVK